MSVEHIFEVYHRIVDALMRRRHVVACGIGLKYKDGQLTDRPSLIVSVERKVPTIDLSDDDIIPDMIDDITTDVIETGEIRALDIPRTALVRPVRPGVSIGHLNGTAGTAGAVVRRGNEVFMLTNNHVAALLNKGRIGDPILQPGPEDGGSTLNIFGQLAEFLPIQFLPERVATTTTVEAASQDAAPSGCAATFANLFSPRAKSPDTLGGPEGQPVSDKEPSMTRVNQVDVALVRPVEGIALDPHIIDLPGAPIGVGGVSLGDAVVKSGRTSGLTEGRVMQINVTVDVAYAQGKARFTNQIMATPFSSRGDSGALVLDARRKAVGLIFSGSETVSVFHPIQTVLDRLNIEMVTK